MSKAAETGAGWGGYMPKALTFAAVAEAATGAALLVVPSSVGQLLLGDELTGAALPLAQVACIALIGLGIACWPGPPLIGMLTYGVGVTLFLAHVGLAGTSAGAFLWPAVVLHGALSVLLGLATASNYQSAGDT